MSEPQLPREVRRRLAIIQHAEEVTGNVAMTCRYYGITRQTFYCWMRRYQEQGVDGLRTVATAARKPERDPGRRGGQDHLPAAELPLRAGQDLDVPQALPRRGGLPVGRLADPQAPGPEPSAGLAALQTARQTVETLREAAARPPGPDRRQVHRAPQAAARPAPAGAPSTTSSPPSTTAPDCGYCGSTPRCDQKTAIQFVDYVLERLPFPVQVIQTDNGAEFQSAFHFHVLDKGIGHRYIKPRTPRLNGKVERPTASTTKSSTGPPRRRRIDDAKLFNNKLREWEDYYNYHRPHGGLGGQPPTNDYAKKRRPSRSR